MAAQDPPDLQRVQLREEVREEVVDELRVAALAEAAEQRDKRIIALAISITLAAGVLLPLAGIIVGLTVRAFRWASGW